MGLISWLVIGALAGWIASILMKGTGSGLLLNIVIGIVGAFIGGFLMNLIGGVAFADFSLGSLLVSVIGAVVLLAIVKLLAKK